MKNCTGIFCPMQYGKVDPATCQAVDYCPQATPPKTKADRIRAMSDEEMAKEFSGQCPAIFGGTRMAGEECAGFESCQDCWLDWLKQEEE